MAKLYIEKEEGGLDLSISEVVNSLLEYPMFDKIPKSKRRKVLARAMASNLIIDELAGQIQFLRTGTNPEED